MQNTKHTAFTLVELIVVITILAILATVAFISFQGYTQQSRDTVRLADMKNIFKSLEMQKLKEIDLPLPDQKVDITASGTIFQYQGVLEENTLANIGLHNGGYDPLTGKPYGYAVNLERNKFQLVGFLENEQTSSYNFLSQSFADNTDKYIKTAGDPLGVILDSTTNEIVVDTNSTGNIDVVQTNTTYNLILKNDIEQGDKTVLKKVHEINTVGLFSHCRELLEKKPELQDKDGLYNIYPDAINIIEVYCDMTTDGGGWTIIGSDGLETLTQSLYLETSTPSPTQKGLVKHFIDTVISDDFSTLKVVAISDSNITAEYTFNQDWAGNLVLSDAEEGYLFTGYYDGFSGGKRSPHKCNFSIVVIGTQGCGTGNYTIGLPYNGVQENAQGGLPTTHYGSIEYTWQFRDGDLSDGANLFRLGWTYPSRTETGYLLYYNERLSSYIMIR